MIDLTETRSIDSTTLGLLAKLSILSRQKVGLLPTVEETSAFLADPSPDKRKALIDRLLERPEFAKFWANDAKRIEDAVRQIGRVDS